MRHVYVRPEVLLWLSDRNQVSPEDDWIARIDGDEGTDVEAVPVPELPGIDEDLVWIWRCRQAHPLTGAPLQTWSAIALMLGLKTPAGAWKRYHRLLRIEREKARLSI